MQDARMLEHTVTIRPATGLPLRIAPAGTPDNALQTKTGQQVADELQGRALLRYLLPKQVGLFTGGSTAKTFVTPTALAPDQLCIWLFVPAPHVPRPYVLLID